MFLNEDVTLAYQLLKAIYQMPEGEFLGIWQSTRFFSIERVCDTQATLNVPHRGTQLHFMRRKLRCSFMRWLYRADFCETYASACWPATWGRSCSLLARENTIFQPVMVIEAVQLRKIHYGHVTLLNRTASPTCHSPASGSFGPCFTVRHPTTPTCASPKVLSHFKAPLIHSQDRACDYRCEVQAGQRFRHFEVDDGMVRLPSTHTKVPCFIPTHLVWLFNTCLPVI